VKLHQVDVLADDVGWRAYLEVVLFVNAGSEVGVIVRDAVVRVRSEEKRFRRFCSGLRRSNVGPERQNARLREVPAGFVQLDIELKRGCFVSAWSSFRVSVIVDAGIGKGSAGLARQSVQYEVCRSAVGLEARVQALFVIDHCGDFSSRSGFGDA